jgi:hypothetical protein
MSYVGWWGVIVTFFITQNWGYHGGKRGVKVSNVWL